MSLIGWEALLKTCSFRGEGQYPIAAYSEFMPPAITPMARSSQMWESP